MSLAREPVTVLCRALHPLTQPPAGSGWNLAELQDVLPANQALTPAAVLIGLIDRGQGLHVVLTRRTDALRHHAGQVSFPGGRIDASDASPIMAALREAREEVGLELLQSTPLGYLDPFATITGFHVFPVVAQIASDFAPICAPDEVAEVFEAPFDFLMNPVNAKSFSLDYRGRTRTSIEFVYGPHRIWGATASMLVNFRERLERAK